MLCVRRRARRNVRGCEPHVRNWCSKAISRLRSCHRLLATSSALGENRYAVCVDLIVVKRCDDAPFGHDEDAIAHHGLRYFRAGDDHGAARSSKIADQLVHILLRADVDTSRWLVADENPRRAHEPSSENPLLLRSAAEGLHRLLNTENPHAEARCESARGVALLALVQNRKPREHRQAREGNVARDRHVRHEALRFAVLRQKSYAKANCVSWRLEAHRLSLEGYGAAGQGSGAGQETD